MPNNKLNVTIDISPIVYGRGVSLYTKNLVRALTANSQISLNLFGISLRQKTKLQKFAQSLPSWKNKKTRADFFSIPPKAMPLLWYQLNFPPISWMIGGQVDVFHAWEELIPPVSKTPVVATIHDLAILKFPETANPSTLSKHRAGWERLKKTQSHVIAVSRATKNDLLELLDFNPNRVHVVYEALPMEHDLDISQTEAIKILEQKNLERPFMLFVGVLEPRKNVPRIIQAWEKFATDYDLVIVGRQEWGVDLPLHPNLHHFARVSAKELASLYNQATIFLYPSLYEGFGLPILEAFSAHTPVVTSNNSAMSEIAGNAAMQVDPQDVESIQQGIDKLLNESKEKRRERTNAMKLRLQLFDWDTTAEKTIKVYQKAAEK